MASGMIPKEKPNGFKYQSIKGAKGWNIFHKGDTPRLEFRFLKDCDISKNHAKTIEILYSDKIIFRFTRINIIIVTGACRLAVIARATILVPCDIVKSLQLVWRS